MRSLINACTDNWAGENVRNEATNSTRTEVLPTTTSFPSASFYSGKDFEIFANGLFVTIVAETLSEFTSAGSFIK
ncbi:hypothetical protein OUZ56_020275 [Daphnia magna]|uniref:Uncharacterized protein n=1 Tax=Daphnia magna TaxID=35525 RepID=A0ABQ9ZE21_9CRUS|nr:hypothetical protein OUZ56_020275 [Daphnia magna]